MALAGAVVALGFSAGGFFPRTVAVLVVGLVVALVLHVTLAARPFSGLSAPYVAGAAALALLAVWTLASSAWSDAPARGILEYNRVLAYLLAFVAFGALGRSELRVRWLVRALAVGIFVVCAAGLISRTMPDVLETTPGVLDERLSFPVTYWNGLGLLAALGLILCAGLSADARETRLVRVLAAAALPVLGATLLLTFSRGAIAAGAAGLVVTVLACRSSALPSAILVAVPAVGIAVASAYGAELLAGEDPRSDAATAQGHDVALVVGLCVVGAALARTVLLRLDGWLVGRSLLSDAWSGPRARGAAVGGAVAAVLLAAIVAGAPGAVERQYDRFVAGDVVEHTEGVRSRLTDPGNNGRVEHWDVALEAAGQELLHGTGAGTYALQWELRRDEVFQVEDAHSLYLEILGELGIVGLALLVVALLLILGGLLRRAAGPGRGPWAALLGAGVAWTLHAGVDWDWEMPVVTLWLFAAGGLALAAPAPERDARAGRAVPELARVGLALGLLVLAVLPARVWSSDRALRDSALAFQDGDCPRAVDRGLDAVSALGSRPEPHAIIAYCDVRLGQPQLAVRAMQRAVERDPGNWEFHYGLGLVRAAAGLDPRGSLNRAARLNPGESMIAKAQDRLASNDPEVWRRRAGGTRLPTD